MECLVVLTAETSSVSVILVQRIRHSETYRMSCCKLCCTCSQL